MKKKMIIAIIAAVVVIGGGIGGYVYHVNQVKAENVAVYKVTAKDMRESSIRLIYGLKFIINDYTTNWSSVIENEKAINISNKIVDCDDFSKAMSWRWSFYSQVGSFQRIDSCFNKMTKELTIIEENKESDTLVLKLFKKEVELIEKLKVMAKKPNGTLLEYSAKASSLFGQLYELDEKLSNRVVINELPGDERIKQTICNVWGEGLLDYPKAKTKVIKITTKDYLFIDLKDNLNKLSY